MEVKESTFNYMHNKGFKVLRPTRSLVDPNVKFDGWFTCDGHCANQIDCDHCIMWFTEEECESEPGAHLWDK